MMYKRLVLLALSISLHQGVLFAQSIYSESGVNTWTRLNYTHLSQDDYRTNHLTSQNRSELGFRKQIAKKIGAYGGFSHDEYAYYLNTNRINSEFKSLYELKYFGVNLGLDYVLVTKQKWTLFLDGKFSRKSLRHGIRSVQETNNALQHNVTTNLLLDDDFPDIKFDVLLGFKCSYRIADWISLYSKYHFSKSLHVVESSNESYGFHSHDLSFGLALDLKQWNLNTNYSKNLVHKGEIVADALIENSEFLEENELLFLKDSNRLKIYFPPNEFQFYPSHINAMEELADVLLESPTMRFQITGYYDRFTTEEKSIQRVESVLGFFSEKGVPRERFSVAYDEVYDEYSTTSNVWNRRVELMRIN